MPYVLAMQIRTSLPFMAPSRKLAPKVQAEKPSFPETALRSTIIGASLGTVAGEVIGKGALIGSAGYLGWRLGQNFGGNAAAGAVGAIAGGVSALFLERKVPIGGTLGSAAGFLTGGVIGGVTGCAVGGFQAIAHSNLFKKG